MPLRVLSRERIKKRSYVMITSTGHKDSSRSPLCLISSSTHQWRVVRNSKTTWVKKYINKGICAIILSLTMFTLVLVEESTVFNIEALTTDSEVEWVRWRVCLRGIVQVDGERWCFGSNLKDLWNRKEKCWFFPPVSLRMENGNVFSWATFPKAYHNN